MLGSYKNQCFSRRNAFTLVELLVTISIIAILASMMLVAMGSAQEAAKADKTRSTIAKLNNIVMERWESYQTRRVPINIAQTAVNKGYAPTIVDVTPRIAARVRVDAVRELMRMEMPERWSDVVEFTSGAGTDPTPKVDAQGNAVPAPVATLMAPTTSALAYLRKFNAAKDADPEGDFPSSLNDRAECLYLMVTAAGSDGGGRELFRESEINDTDSDGIPEFVDGWGRPIQFLRWAPGFVSDLQPADPSTLLPPLLEGAGKPKNPDPFDPAAAYPSRMAPPADPTPHQLQLTFALFPLIYSSGPDGAFDIYGGPDNMFNYGEGNVNNNPFLQAPELTTTGETAPGPIGLRTDALDNNGRPEWYDNITNHSLGTK